MPAQTSIYCRLYWPIMNSNWPMIITELNVKAGIIIPAALQCFSSIWLTRYKMQRQVVNDKTLFLGLKLSTYLLFSTRSLSVSCCFIDSSSCSNSFTFSTSCSFVALYKLSFESSVLSQSSSGFESNIDRNISNPGASECASTGALVLSSVKQLIKVRIIG